jgi:hypothetical protein
MQPGALMIDSSAVCLKAKIDQQTGGESAAGVEDSRG